MTGGVKVKGDAELAAAFKALPDELMGRVMLRTVGRIFKKAALRAGERLFSAGRERTGALRRSLVGKAKFYKRSNVLYAILGPNKDATETFQGKIIKPVKYAHLQELGATTATPAPFIKPSVEELGPEIVDGLRKGIIRAVKNVAKKGRK